MAHRATLALLLAIAVASLVASSAALDRPGVRAHVHLHTDPDSSTTIKIQNRLPEEDKDTLLLDCKAEFEGEALGYLVLEEVSPYATIWEPDIYGETDKWSCKFEWVNRKLVVDSTLIWNKEGSVTWKLDSYGLLKLQSDGNSYDLVKLWTKKSEGVLRLRNLV